MSYTVGQLAALAGVSVRTLHHYDEIGLLTPGERSAAGYRRYTDLDLERLQHILHYRELGFALDEIAAVLAEPDADATTHLRRQHRLLRERIEHLQKMLTAVEYAMEAEQMGVSLSPQERFEVFGDFDPDQYEEEAQQRWGETDAYKESQRRVKRYTKQDWLTIKAQSAANVAALVEAMRTGAPADSVQAMDLAEEHRAQISNWFYECTFEIHRGLGEMYVADHRFRAHYDVHLAGLADYLREAIVANAVRHGH